MHTLFVILAINLATFGFAFSFAGFLGLAPPNEAEAKVQREAFERERTKGFWYGELHSWREQRRLRARIFSILASHWPERPDSRWLICLGITFLASALLMGIFLGSFS
jgi:hypothetical protein